MNLRDYLEQNTHQKPNKDEIHPKLILDFIDRLDEFDIRHPNKIYREVRIIEN